MFEESNVFVQKSGTDFNTFSNMVVLDGVERLGYETYVESINDQAETIGYDMSKLEVFYTDELKRMIISERIPVTDRFAQEVKM